MQASAVAIFWGGWGLHPIDPRWFLGNTVDVRLGWNARWHRAEWLGSGRLRLSRFNRWRPFLLTLQENAFLGSSPGCPVGCSPHGDLCACVVAWCMTDPALPSYLPGAARSLLTAPTPNHSLPVVLPDLDTCQARSTGLTSIADCLVSSPEQCKYALSFGYGFFCRHPLRDEIIRNTPARG